MSDCIFCKIAKGEIPSNCLWDSEGVYAFRDINPQAPTHILVIPKEHVASSMAEVNESNSAAVAKCLEVIAKLARDEGLDSGYRVISNCGADGGQTVPHLHFHLLGGKKLGEMLV